MRVLYIGKFQPFHNGHKRITNLARNIARDVIIGMGSPQMRDFFSTDERIEMIRKNTLIEPILLEDLEPTHELYNEWGKYVLDIIGNIDVVITGNELVKTDFLTRGVPVLTVPRYDGISGSAIRESMMKDNEKWREMVTSESREVIEKSAFYRSYRNHG